MRLELLEGDCLEVLKGLGGESVDSIVTDPPYGLSFMGRKWDYDVPSVEAWAECLRVLKPGGHLLAFAGTRTQHRMAVRIEDAGFEIRDLIAWVYGSGFPKSHNLDGEWQGWGTALKPALEPITVARKPLVGTVAENVLRHGTGAINVDGCRVGTSKQVPASASTTPNAIYGKGLGSLGTGASGSGFDPNIGRWPANLIHDGSDEVVELFPESKSCNTPSIAKPEGKILGGARSQGAIYPGETGSAARFFYCAKASKADRGEGNNHPTVKPTELMRYLCRLVTPPGGVVLDPFMGTGSTGKAAVLEGLQFIGIEREAEYLAIARQRVKAPEGSGQLSLLG